MDQIVCHGFVGCAYAFISAIPVPLISAVFAAVAALAGVALTSRDARQRLKIQLTHDATEKLRDREHAARGKLEERQSQLRREVFMDAFDGVTSSIQALGRMAELKMPLSSIVDSLALGASKMARVRAIGNHETVKALTALASAITVANITLIQKRAPLDGRVKFLADLEVGINRENADSNRWLEMQSQMLVQGPLPQQRFDYIQGRIELHRKEANRLIAIKAEVARGIDLETLAIVCLLVEQQRTLSTAAVEANAAMRRELGFSGEHEEEVRSAFAKQDDAARAALEKFLRATEEQISAGAPVQPSGSQSSPLNDRGR